MMHETIMATLESLTRETLDLDDILDRYDEGLGEHYMGLFYNDPVHVQAAITLFEDVLEYLQVVAPDPRPDDAIAYWHTQVTEMLAEARADLRDVL